MYSQRKSEVVAQPSIHLFEENERLGLIIFYHKSEENLPLVYHIKPQLNFSKSLE